MNWTIYFTWLSDWTVLFPSDIKDYVSTWWKLSTLYDEINDWIKQVWI